MKKQQNVLMGTGCWLVFAVVLWGVWQNAGWVHRLDRFGYRLLQPTTPLRTHFFTVVTHLGDPILLLPFPWLSSPSAGGVTSVAGDCGLPASNPAATAW
ncbi:hypothetical protein [Limosilactobacillus pontis]|uniref:Uncharacterized protein n=1 Tax=Limosilactobacillus pontis TaxID=35787 RepID=A0ABU7SQZ9_9LACO